LRTRRRGSRGEIFENSVFEIATTEQRQFLGLGDVDEPADDLVVLFVVDPERIQPPDRLLVEMDLRHR